MYDGIFIINSALSAPAGLSIYDNKTRFEQTIETLDSIDEKCKNNLKIIFDCSPIDIDEDYLKIIGTRSNTWFLDMGKHEVIQLYSMNGLRSLAETCAFIGVLQWIQEKQVEGKRIYKLSGRYRLTDSFVLESSDYDNAFVFADALSSWMDPSKQIESGADKLYRLRLWHMDYSLLTTLANELPTILNDCGKYGIDIEHAYYKHLNKYKVVEVPKIGVEGNIAPSGEYINE